MTIVRIGLMVLIFVLLLALPLGATAQEAKYSFASAQGTTSLQAIPGGEAVSGLVYFYNVDGNRITYINLKVAQVAALDQDGNVVRVLDDWEVEITPAAQDIQVSLNPDAPPVTVKDVNLYAEPTAVSSTEITDVSAYCGEHGYVYSDDMVCLTLPSKLGEGVPGYAVARTAIITVSVPESEAIGTTGEIKITAEANWLGQTGSAAISQTRDFDLTYTTVYEITQEQIITGKGFDIGRWHIGIDIGRWLPYIIAGVVVILMGVFFYRFAPRRK